MKTQKQNQIVKTVTQNNRALEVLSTEALATVTGGGIGTDLINAGIAAIQGGRVVTPRFGRGTAGRR